MLFRSSLVNAANDAESLALRCLLGIILLGTGLFLIGQLFFGWQVFIPILTPFAIRALYRIVDPSYRTRLRQLIAEIGWTMVPVLTLFAILLLSGLQKPTGVIGSDGISYHLYGPATWIRASVIRPVTDMLNTSYPAISEVLFGVVMSLSNDRAAGVFGAVIALVFLVLVWGIARELFASVKSARWAVLISLSAPVLFRHQPYAFVDLTFSAMAIAAIWRLLHSVEPAQVGCSGILLGGTLGTKYTGIFVCGVSLIVFIVYLLPIRSIRRTFELSLILVATALAVGGPWYLRNYLILNAPIYPPPVVLAKIMGAPHFLSPDASAIIQSKIRMRGYGSGRSFLDLVLLPWRITFSPHQFHGATGIGVAILALAPVGFLICRKKIHRAMLTWAVLLTAVWFYTQQEARFAYHMLTVYALFAGAGAAYLWEHSTVVLRSLTAGVVGISIAYGLGMIAKEEAAAIRSALSPIHESAWVERETAFYPAFAYLNRRDEVKRVVLVGIDIPPYFVSKPHIKPFGLYGERPLPQIQTESDLIVSLPTLDVTHVLASQGSGLTFSNVPSLQLVLKGSDFELYEVGSLTINGPNSGRR